MRTDALAGWWLWVLVVGPFLPFAAYEVYKKFWESRNK
jgi:hypothetical protein